ncbi:hypothetical protein [Halarchaeum salinum]
MSKDGQNQQHTQTVFSRFNRLESELDCLLLAVRNMLADYRNFHPDFPINPGEDADDDENPKKAAKDELKILAGHRSRFGGNFSQLEARLNGRLDDTSFEAYAATQMDLDGLGEILDTETASLPLVELDPAYFDKIDEYNVQAGQYGASETPILIPIQVEDDIVIYWDPLADYYDNENEDPVEMTLSETTFLRLWSRAARARWTLWLDGQEQKKMAEFMETDQ